MQDKIIARRHNAYRLKAGTVVDVDPGKGPLAMAGIGPATMEKVSVSWDDGDPSSIVRRFPVDVHPGDRLYVVGVESGVSVHPDRPIFLFNASNGHQHREVNAPSIRTRMQLVGDRLPIILAAIVAAAFLSVYDGRNETPYHELRVGLAIAVAALMLAWAALMFLDVRRNRQRAERLEDELSAAREGVDFMNQDISSRLSADAPQEDQAVTLSTGRSAGD